MSPPSISSTTPAPSPLRCSPHVRTLLRRLHDLSTLQEVNIPDDEWTIVRDRAKTDPTGSTKAVDELMIDKFIALDEDKAMFVYNLILATGATTVVEAGTSFGVSTMYLALAVGQNCANMGENDAEGASEGNSGETKREIVIGTEKEESKAQIARKHWQEAGPEIQKWIDLRVGDLNETLSGDMGLEKGQQVDFLLLDSKLQDLPLYFCPLSSNSQTDTRS